MFSKSFTYAAEFNIAVSYDRFGGLGFGVYFRSVDFYLLRTWLGIFFLLDWVRISLTYIYFDNAQTEKKLLHLLSEIQRFSA